MAEGRSTTGDMVQTGKMMMNQANANIRVGPGVQNLGPSADKQANPKDMIRNTAGKTFKGPDLGGGGA